MSLPTFDFPAAPLITALKPTVRDEVLRMRELLLTSAQGVHDKTLDVARGEQVANLAARFLETIKLEGDAVGYETLFERPPNAAVARLIAANTAPDLTGTQLLALIDAADFWRSTGVMRKLWEMPGPRYNQSGRKPKGAERKQTPGVWVGSAADLEKCLTGEMEPWGCSVEEDARKFFKTAAIERVLSRLKSDFPGRVSQVRTDTARLWSVCQPEDGA